VPTDELPDVLPEFALLPQHQPEPALFGDGESASEPECPADDDGEQDDDAGNALFPGLDFGLTLGCLGFVSVKNLKPWQCWLFPWNRKCCRFRRMSCVSSVRNTDSRSLKAVLESWKRTTARVFMQNDPLLYRGLGSLDDKGQQSKLVGIRLVSLVLWFTSNALPATYYEELVSLLDSFFPGELGEINHSKNFVSRMRDTCFRVLRRFQFWELHGRLSAIQIPSDFVTLSDGVSCANGCPLHIQVLQQEGRHGRSMLHLLSLAPVATTAEGDSPDCVSVGATMKYSSAVALVSKARTVEGKFGISDDIARLRFAGRVGDGLEEGPDSIRVGETHAHRLKLEPPGLFGSLDPWHASETAGGHSDTSCRVPVIHAYEVSARAMRSRFVFGSAQAVPGAVQKRFGVQHVARLAPVGGRDATRTLKSESVTIAKNYLLNVKSNAYSLMVVLRAVINKAKEDSVRLGHKVGPCCGVPSALQVFVFCC